MTSYRRATDCRLLSDSLLAVVDEVVARVIDCVDNNVNDDGLLLVVDDGGVGDVDGGGGDDDGA
jgi:hypothetical protein